MALKQMVPGAGGRGRRVRRVDRDFRKLTWFFEAIVENIPTMVFVKDATDLRFELFNRAGEALLGIPRSELHGKSDRDFFPAAQAEHFIRKDREVLAKGEVIGVEEPIKTKHGDRWLFTKKIPVRDDEGVPRYLLGVSLDITDRKKAETELAKTNAALKEALEQVMAMEPMVMAGAVAKEHAAELCDLLDKGDEASLARARELAKRIREAVR
ncbi:MAG: PAS domain-containing protein [Minicystis sp.]